MSKLDLQKIKDLLEGYIISLFKVIGENFRTIVFFGASWTLGLFFLNEIWAHIDFTKGDKISVVHLTILGISVIIVLLPFFKSIKIPNIVELETQIDKTKEELEDTNKELQNLRLEFSQTMMNVVSYSQNSVQQIQFFQKPQDELSVDLQELQEEKANNPTVQTESNKIHQEYANESDPRWKIIKLRIDIERELRRVLQKKLETTDPSNEKFISLYNLARKFVKEYPAFDKYSEQFNTFRKINNSLIHGQKISDEYIRQASEIGIELLAILKAQR